jgi:hypothetical protein
LQIHYFGVIINYKGGDAKLDFAQQKTGLNNYTVITQETINRIVHLKAFESSDKQRDSALNNLLYDYHKELLYKAIKNNNKEVGLFWDLKDLDRKPLVIIGEINGFRMSSNQEVYELVECNKYIRSVALLHNHPRNGLFSGEDLKSFTDHDSIYFMTAVCNDGTIHMLRKESNFNPFLLYDYYNAGVAKSDKKATQDLKDKIKRLGLDINNPQDKEKIKNIQTTPYYFGTKNVIQNAQKIGITYRCSIKRK